MNNQGLKQTRTIWQFFQSYAAVIAAFLTMIVSYGFYYSFGVFFKPMLIEFGWTRAMTSGAFSFSWLVVGFLGIFMGGLTDKYGARLVLSICGLLGGIGYLLMSQINEFWQIYLFYGLLIGTGNSNFSALMSTIARLYVERRTLITGIVTVGVGIGSLLLPPLANQLMMAYDWRTSFVVIGIITLVVLIVSAQFLQSHKIRTESLTQITEETAIRSAALDIQALSFSEAIITRQFWIIFVMFFCLGFSIFTAQVHLVPYATDINISPTIAANILAAIGGSSIVGRVALGGLGDKFGNRRAFIIGFILITAPILCLAFAREMWMLFLIAIILGFGYGGCVASQSPLTASIFGLKSIGLIFGVLCAAVTIGAAVGPLVAAHIFDVATSYQTAFILTAAVGAIGLISSIVLSPIRAKVES